VAAALAWLAPIRRHSPAIAGVSMACFGTGLAVATVVVAWLDRNAPPWLPGLSVGWTVGVQMVVEGLGLLTWSIVAAVIVWRQPRNRVSWVIGPTAVLLAILVFSGHYAFHGLFVAPGSLPLAATAAPFQLLGGAPAFIGVFLLALLFPDGHLKSARWLLLAIVTPVIYLVDMIGRLDHPSPLNVSPIGQLIVPVTVPPSAWPVGALVSWTYPWVGWAEVALGIVIATYLVLRLTQSSGEARLQLKWFTYAVAIGAVALLAGQANAPPLRGVLDPNTLQAISLWAGLAVVVVGTILLPGAIGIAVLRYRLYDIDVVISRTILYGGLAVFVAGTYGIVVGGIGSLLGQHGGMNPLLTILAIAVAAVLLEPVRARLQGLANIAIYGRRTSPYQVLSDFARGIGRAEPSDVLLPRMAQLLRDGTGAANVEVWVRVGDRLHRVASSPPKVGLAQTVGGVDELSRPGTAIRPVFHDGELLGALTLIEPRGETINAAEQRLLDDLASQAGLVFSRYRLIEELRESRTRIVAAQDLERRQLQRNLHDGAQQRFVNALLALGLAQADGSEGSPDLLETATDEVKAGLAELRNLARGLHPALLAESGLHAALVTLADRVPIIITVLDAPDRRYPEPVEVTAYYIVAEALANAAKHSRASAIDVRIDEIGGRLRLEIADDGVGGADITRGSGLIGLQDRASAIGGTLTVQSPPGAGTVVRAELPCE
jgi:signal transduction histidine kinase